ncbi:MAG: response regulator [Chloroflexaceae bacterium]
MLDAEAEKSNEQIKPAILIVDDDVNVTRSLARSLRDQFVVFTANSAAEALEVIAREDIAVVLTDQRMPGLTGVELLERAQHIRPDAVGIIISGYTDIVALVDAINLGTVRGYVPKPWDVSELRHRLDNAVRTYRASFLNREVLHSSAEAISRMQDEIADLYRALDMVASGEASRLFLAEEEPQQREREQLAASGAHLHERMPEVFQQFILRYEELLDLALDQRAFKVDHRLSDKLRALSKRLGQLRAGPRDLVEIHSMALKKKVAGTTPNRKQAAAEEGRLMLLELMGYLTTYYRLHLLAIESSDNRSDNSGSDGA